MSQRFTLIAEAGGFAPDAQDAMRAHLEAHASIAFGVSSSSFLLFPSEDDRARFLQRFGGEVRGSSTEIHPWITVGPEVAMSTIGGPEDAKVQAFAAWCQARWPCHVERHGERVELDAIVWRTERENQSWRIATAFPAFSTLDSGRYTIGSKCHGGPERGIYSLDREDGPEQRSDRCWVVIGQRQPAPYAEIAARLALPFAGVAPLLHVGPVFDIRNTHNGLYDGLVEELPAGWDTDEDPPDGSDAIDAALALAGILVEAHAAGRVLLGIRPETVFTVRDGRRRRFAGIAPRCEAFWASARPPAESAPPAFEHFYFPIEVLVGRPATPASDVFSLCAVLAHWVSGYPFAGDDIVSRLGAVMQNTRTPWTGPAALQPIIDRGLASDPARRPAVAQLIADLSSAKLGM